MAAKQPTPTPRNCIHHSGFTKQYGWLLRDLSLNLCGNIAVSSYNENTDETSIHVYSVSNFDSREKPNIFYSKQFEKYESEGRIFWGRYVSFVDPTSHNMILTCIGDELEVIDLIIDRVLKSRKITVENNGRIKCLSVRKREIFLGFSGSNKITVYDVNELNEIKSIILQGIQDGHFPFDMTATADKIFVCVGDGRKESNERSLIFEEENGRVLSELTKPSNKHWFAQGITVNMTLGVVAVAWSQTYEGSKRGMDVIIFYSLFSENYSSFHIVEVKIGVGRIRISDRGDMMVMGNRVAWEVKTYDMASFFTYHDLKENLTSQLQTNDCVRLIKYFTLNKDQSDDILKSEASTDNLLLLLEERGALQPFNVAKLIEAFNKLNISSSCYHLLDFYKKTRQQATSYDRFMATLSGHLTASLPEDLCEYFHISEHTKIGITSSQNPGLSLLLALDEMKVINSTDVGGLEQPFTEFMLVQAVAMIDEYQSIIEEEKSQLMAEVDGKRELFIRCLQKKIKSWYETMTPVPWKKSCRWKSTDLFVGSGLVLSNSNAKRILTNIDEQCKLNYTEIFTHERLKSETRLILEGDPGSGKTMLASQLAYDWSQGKIDELDILIFLPLKLVEKKTLVESIWEFYVPKTKNLSVSDIEDVIKDGGIKCCFILDGLEEYSEEGDTSEVVKVMAKNKYPSCKVIITSRSDFAQCLPSCPMLKLGRFGNTERNAYIEKVFSGDPEKEVEVKNIIEDNPFILDLCSVPVLFVLIVHNIESMGSFTREQLDRVTPFMKNMVKTLCLSKIKTTDLDSDYVSKGATSLGEVAYNGLCRGIQQLVWQKDFIEMNVRNSKQWLESGILVVDDSNASIMARKDQHQTLPEEPHQDTPKTDSCPVVIKKPGTWQRIYQLIRNRSKGARQNNENAALAPGARNKLPAKSQYDVRSKQDKEAGSVAKHVPLLVKFLHKIIQEWFAARHFSLTISKLKSLEDQQRYLSECLPRIHPADLHYVLRFSCALYPPCCHFIIKHLLRTNNWEKGGIPENIMHCAFLCFAEFDGVPGPDILEAVKMICKENITIHSEDSRLLQQAKVSVMKFASNSEIMIKKVVLYDLVISATKDVLTFNSGLTMEVIKTLYVIEISRWDHQLREEDYQDIVKFVANCSSLEKANLSFPVQPPELEKETLIDLLIENKTVTWIIGSRLSQTLDTTTGEWKMPIKEHQTTTTMSSPAKYFSVLLQQSLLNTKAIITKDSATVTIPGTKVVLNIPPGALPEHMDKCCIKMRIIPPKLFEDQAITFSSNSSVVVEILPNNLALQRPAQLRIPHCLILKETATPTAKVFMSHHEEGFLPRWVEHSDIGYSVERTHCVVLLNRFCWVTIKVDDKEVLAKKLILYTCGEKLKPTDWFSTIVVGYYPELDGEGQYISLNKSMTVSERSPFNFMKEGSRPLCLLLARFESNQWKLWFPKDGNATQEISFDEMCASGENRRKFTLRKTVNDALSPMCIVKASQEQGQQLQLQICPELLQPSSYNAAVVLSSSGNRSEPQTKTEEDSMKSTFRYLCKELEQEWQWLGRELHVPNADLCHIKTENPVTQDAIYAMLQRWKHREGSDATYTILIKSLKKAGRKDLAEKVANRKDL